MWIKHPNDGHEYAASQEAASWSAAAQACMSNNGHLASIPSAMTNTWLALNVLLNQDGLRVWIGEQGGSVRGVAI